MAWQLLYKDIQIIKAPPCNDMCPYHWSQVPLIYLFSSTLRFSVGGVIACHRWVYWRPHLIETPQQYSIPVYSGKQIVSGDFLIFSSNKSFLFRKRIMDVSVNHLLLQIESNSFKLSCIRFWKKKGISLYFNWKVSCTADPWIFAHEYHEHAI